MTSAEQSVTTTIDISGCKPIDSYCGAPYIDQDRDWTEPATPNLPLALLPVD